METVLYISDVYLLPWLSNNANTKHRTFTLAVARYTRITGPWSNIKMTSYQYRKSHCGDKTVVRSSYLHNGISYTGKISSLYWIGAQGPYQYKDHLASYRVPHYKDKTVMRPLYLDEVSSYTGQMAFLYWDSSLMRYNNIIANGCSAPWRKHQPVAWWMVPSNGSCDLLIFHKGLNTLY